MTLERALLIKSTPKFGSKRYEILQKVCWEKGLWPTVNCEICGTYLLNPRSILLHQGSAQRNTKRL